MARPAHVKVFTAEETDRAGDKGHLHAITLRGAAYYSSPGLSRRLVFVRASLVPYGRPVDRRGTPARLRMADSASRGIMPNCECFRLSGKPL